MRQKVHVYQLRILRERYMSLVMIPPTFGGNSSNKPGEEQKKI